MSSLKMTFSLASLVLLMAFIAMPVMAQDAMVKSVTAPKYVGFDTFTVTVTFENVRAADATVTPEVTEIVAPTATNFTIAGSLGFAAQEGGSANGWTVLSVDNTDATEPIVYTATVRANVGADTPVVISVGTNVADTPAVPADESADPARANGYL